jgi:hypothetical protein
MSKPYPALCRECKWSRKEDNRGSYLRCVHPIVNANDPWALSGGSNNYGSDTHNEREKRGWFANCGMKGKLWEPKNV